MMPLLLSSLDKRRSLRPRVTGRPPRNLLGLAWYFQCLFVLVFLCGKGYANSLANSEELVQLDASIPASAPDSAKRAAARDIVNREMTVDARATFDGAAPTDASQNVDECRDLHLDCDAFADQGHCDSMPGQMAVYCPIACNSCHLRDRKERCKKENIHGQNARPSPTDNPNIEYMTYNRSAPIYAPGDMNRMFESIIPRFQKRYSVNILSRSPYVVTIDDFLSGEEVRALTKHVDGWERSTDTGQLNALGASGKKLSTGRTSSNAWCSGQCESHPVVTNIYNKIAEITKVPRSYYETFQVLRYEIGQKYEVHHDNGQQSQTNENSSGPRILTFFLYLSDVDEGGETTFPALGLSVQPKRGRALLWPSVLNEDILKNDGRTLHEAKPVIRGRKFAANTWIHAYDFTLASQWMCSGGVGAVDASFVARLIS